jgi:uncharacterized protein (DUF2336 family)
MFSGLLAKLFPIIATSLLDEEERAIAQKGSEKARIALAKSEKASQEILHYMAEEDDSARVREAVAKNPSAPLSVAPILSKDTSQDVRLKLAQRLVAILPDLPADKHSQLYAFAVQALGDLALDEVIKIRRALTETLKDYAHTPPSVAFQLAKDLERTVSEPILRFCTALSDEALIEVLETHPANWAAEAVAQRDKVSAPVSRAIFDTGNRKAGKFLIENKGATISSSLLEDIVERAREYPEWHKPIAARAELPPLMAAKLAAFAESSARKILMERSDLDKTTINEVMDVMQRRLEYGTEKKKAEKKKKLDPETTESAQVRAARFHSKGELTESLLGDALAMQDKEFVLESISLLTGYGRPSINRIFDARAAKSICALCWKAGLSMRFALQLQQILGRVPVSSLIYPKGGTDYPFPEDEMSWQLELLGMR